MVVTLSFVSARILGCAATVSFVYPPATEWEGEGGYEGGTGTCNFDNQNPPRVLLPSFTHACVSTTPNKIFVLEAALRPPTGVRYLHHSRTPFISTARCQ
ncbi:hypothetical protein ACMFMG_004839 [Clarireedia jacksonii]